ncbi:hypothetical protein BJX64DRAFT_283747 [Aspergillus heterothallicus]
MDQRNPTSRQTPKEDHTTNGTSNRNNSRASMDGHETNDVDTETPEYYQTFLRRLIAVISHEQPEAVDGLIAIIRSGASQEEIFRALSELTAETTSAPANRTRQS